MRTALFRRWSILLLASTCLGCAEGSPDLTAQNETVSGGFVDLVGVIVEDSCDVNMAAMPPIRQIALGLNASFALDNKGHVWSWGILSAGESYGPTPALMNDLSEVKQIAAGQYHACALLADGALRCWGRNDFGQLGNGTTSGTFGKPVDVIGLDKVVQVSCGQYHTCAVREDRTLWCWGQRGSFQHWVSGDPYEQDTPHQILEISDTVLVGAGHAYFTCALSATNQLICWGFEVDKGETTPTYYAMPTSGPVKQLSTGWGACVLLEDHTIQCFNEIPSSQAGPWTDVTEFSMGNYGRLFCASLRGEETKCYSNTPDIYDPLMAPANPLPNIGAVTHLAVGAEHACGMDKGCMKCWGKNQWGQAGIGSNEDARRPTPVQWAKP